MKKLILIFTLTVLLVFLLIFIPKLVSHQFEARSSSGFNYAPGKIVIQFAKKISPVIPVKIIGIIQTGIASVDELCLTFKVHTMGRQFPNPKYSTPDLTRHFVVKFDKSINLDQVVNAFSKIPFIEKVEKVGLHKFDSEPNDDNYPQQWHLNQTSDCDIDAPEAWDIQKGNDSVILAVVDSGVRYTHPDLNNNIWINPGETGLDQWGFPKETNNRDDDNNGYIDDVHGWDFIDNDNDPSDKVGHGTHIAGIAAAETNNGRGVAGVAGGWNPESDYGQKGCKIMCLRSAINVQDMSNVAPAIQYATDKEALAINCSWRNSDTGGFGDAVDYAIQNGVLIIASAGNDNLNDPSYLNERGDCLDVAATDNEDQKAYYSNWGSWVDVAAPGGEGTGNRAILSTSFDGGYGWKSGTSMAVPMVLGLAGLIKSERPDWGREKIRDAIVESADYIGVIHYIGSGRINADYALKQTWGTPATPSNLTADAVEYFRINLSWQDNSNNENGFEIQRKQAGGKFSKIATVWRNCTYYQDENVSANTTYYYRVRAYNINGNSSFSNIASATTPPDPSVPPQAPSNLIAYGYCWEVKLTWQDNSDNEEKFIIERKSGPNWYPLDYVGPNITSYWDIDLWCGMLWCYRMRAYNQAGYSPYSNTACAKTTSCYYCDPWDFKITPDKEIINPEESITYTYELKNKGNVDLIDIELIDYKFGIIATKFTLKKGETRNFTKTVTLTETTTNFAEATAKYHHEDRIVSIKTNAQATVEVRK